MSQTSTTEPSDVIEDLQDVQEEIIDDVEETDDAGGGADESTPPTQEEPEEEPEVPQQPQVDPEVVANWLKSQGYSVQREEAKEKEEEEIPDPMYDPQGYAAYVQEKTLEAAAPFLKPTLVDQAIKGIQEQMSSLGIELPDNVVETMKQDASAAKLSELQAMLANPAQMLHVGAHYYRNSAPAKPKAQPGPVKSPTEVPVGVPTASQSVKIPKDILPMYQSYLESFGKQDSQSVRKSYLESLGRL